MIGGSNKLVSAAEAAAYLDVDVKTLLRNRDKWELPSVAISNRIKFRVRDLDAFIQRSVQS